MLPRGFGLVVDRATGGARGPITDAIERGIVLEDVHRLPFGGTIERGALSHLWPLAPMRCGWLARHARREADPLERAEWAGRAAHVLVDLCCPAHARPSPHYLHDPFERYVEAHVEQLRTLALPPEPALDSAAALAWSLGRAARRHRAPWTWPVRRGPKLSAAEVRDQAESLVPLAAAYLSRLLALLGVDPA